MVVSGDNGLPLFAILLSAALAYMTSTIAVAIWLNDRIGNSMHKILGAFKIVNSKLWYNFVV